MVLESVLSIYHIRKPCNKQGMTPIVRYLIKFQHKNVCSGEIKADKDTWSKFLSDTKDTFDTIMNKSSPKEWKNEKIRNRQRHMNE